MGVAAWTEMSISPEMVVRLVHQRHADQKTVGVYHTLSLCNSGPLLQIIGDSTVNELPANFDVNRFWNKVEKAGRDTCWVWIGARQSTNSYGRMKIDGAIESAHRISYMLEHGRIADGLWVLHKCDNPPCVNPSHLFLGNRSDNMKDAYKKGRAFEPHKHGYVSYGENVSTAKLTNAQAEMIRESDLRISELARAFSVSRKAIRNVRQGKSFKKAHSHPSRRQDGIWCICLLVGR